MPVYNGFSTKNVCQVRDITTTGVDGGIGNIKQEPYIGKKFRLTDENLVIQDFINAFSIKQGDKVGNPGYGTILWTFIFEPNNIELRSLIQDEIRRIASLDPRLTVGTIQIYGHDNGVLIEMQMMVERLDSPINMALFFNRNTSTVDQIF